MKCEARPITDAIKKRGSEVVCIFIQINGIGDRYRYYRSSLSAALKLDDELMRFTFERHSPRVKTWYRVIVSTSNK